MVRSLLEKGRIVISPEAIAEMHSMEWYHRIDLGDGVTTPGPDWGHLWGPIRAEMSKEDFHGKSVLEVGCWDGMWSFEAERLGAKRVIATDIPSQRSYSEQGPRTLLFAKQHLGSDVEYREASVYDLDQLFEDAFDIVIFYGVLYHLRYPQLGVAKIRNVLKTGGLLLLETSVITGTDETVIQTDHRKIHPTDTSTWNSFSVPALLAMLDESYLKPHRWAVIDHPDHTANRDPLRRLAKRIIRSLPGHRGFFTYTRAFVVARAFEGVHPHHPFPDPYLERFYIPGD
jgi:tRNA (mo5U34)-methyltransferase